MKRLWVVLLWVPLLAAQRIPGEYIVELTGEPAAAQMAKTGRRSASTPRAEIKAAQAALERRLEARGAEITGAVDTVANALIVRIPDSQAAQLASEPGVLRVYPVYAMKLHLDRALPLHSVPDAWSQIGGMENAGAGVKIAILDTGIDQNHPGFQDPSLVIPAGFPKFNKEADQALTNNKVIVARSYGVNSTAEDRYGHGTAVAMAAAGVPNQGTMAYITGVAPKAYLGNYNISAGGGRSISSSKMINALDDAVKDGMDVVNISSGGLAARPEDDIVVKAVENAIAAGLLVVVSAGNEGPDPNTVSSPATAPSGIAVGASWNDRVFATSVLLDGVPLCFAYPGSGPAPAGPVTAPLADIAPLDPTGMACSALPEGSLSGKIAIVLRGICTFEEKLNNAGKAGAAGAVIYTDADRPEADFMMNVGAASLPAMLVSYRDGMSLKDRAAGTGPVEATLRFAPGPFPVNPNRVAAMSSRGPGPDEGIKPDLVATGTYVHTATQKASASKETMYDASGYATESGTSFSAPLVAGAAAVLKAARPGLTTAQYRSLLVNSAGPFASGNSAPAQAGGAGALNLAAALQNTMSASPCSLSFGAGGGTVDFWRDLTISNLGTAPDTFSISVLPLAGEVAPIVSDPSIQIAPGGARTVSVRFTGAGLAPGQYHGFLQVQGSTSSVPMRVPYWYAVRSDVPAYLTILHASESGQAGAVQREAMIFRITDRSGIPVLDAVPVVKVLSGGGTVNETSPADDLIPGAYIVSVTLGPKSGDNVFQIQAGELTKTVVIAGTSPFHPALP